MRLPILTTTLAFCAGAALAQGQPLAGAGEDKPPETQAAVAPFGGTFESRLDRLDSDIQMTAKAGKLPADQAQALAGQVQALRTEVKAIRERNRGDLPDADNDRLQQRVTALSARIDDLADAAKERTTSGPAR